MKTNPIFLRPLASTSAALPATAIVCVPTDNKNKIYPLLCFLIYLGILGGGFSNGVVAQTVFGPQQVIDYAGAIEPQLLAIEDLNSDGYRDMLVGMPYEYEVYLYLNDGTGNFSNSYSIATDVYIESGWRKLKVVDIADINSDGFYDLVYIKSNSNRLVWKENDGAGNFGNQKQISSNTEYAGEVFTIADFNNDGTVDVLSISVENNSFYFYSNDGIGNFTLTQTIITDYPFWNNFPYETNKVFIEDYNTDGNLDIGLAFENEHVFTWYENDGSANFTLHQLFIPTTNIIINMQPIDINEDGNLDVLLTNSSTFEPMQYMNVGNDTLFQGDIISASPSVLFGAELQDINGDGLLDIVSRVSDGNMVWFENLEGDSIGPMQMITTYDEFTSTFFLDVEGDGDVDIARTIASSILKFYLNDGSGNFTTLIMPNTRVLYTSNLVATDIDGISGNELIFVQPESNELIWKHLDINPENPIHYIVGPELASFTSLNTADLNSNEKTDIFLSCYENSKILYYENLGNGEFSTKHIISDNYLYPTALLAVDMDNDNDLDMLVSSEHPKIVWFENDGTGEFLTKNTLAEGVKGINFQHTDLNGDGLEDIVFRQNNGFGYNSALAWFKNLGTGFDNLQIVTELSLIDHPYNLSDLNSDGFLDIIAFWGNETAIKWRRNLGTGIFASWQPLVTEIDSINAIEIADIDGNETLDMLASDFENHIVRWFSNDGIGNFVSENLITIATTYPNLKLTGIKVADLDNDNKPDIVIKGNGPYNYIEWLKNQTGGIFEEAETIIYANGVIPFLKIEDVNLDGALDIVIALDRYNAIKVLWYENLLFTGINPPTASSVTLHITPNPTQNTATLTYTSPQSQAITLQLHGLTGRLLHTQTLQATTGSNQYVLDMSRYAQGLYVVTLNNGVEVVSGKVVKE